MVFAETESVELEERLNDNFIKVVVSFLNTHDGTVYIGVKDNGEIIGVPDTDKTLQEIVDIITMQILPDPQDLIELGTKYIGGKSVVEVKINKGNALYYIKKYGRSAAGCFLRVGSTGRSMTEGQIERRFVASITIPKRTMKEEASPRQDLSFGQFKTLLAFKNVHYNLDSFDQNFNLRNATGQYNYIAFLVSDQNDTSIKVVRFHDVTKSEFISRKEFDAGCIFKQMDDALEYTLNILNIVQTNIIGAERVDTPYFDSEVFREVWYNAVCHNLWVEHIPPAVYGYDDRVEIISHGLLTEGLTQEDFFNGVSKPVNEEFAKIFIQMHYMKQAGRGVPTVVKKYGRRVYTFGTSFIQCILPYNILSKAKQERMTAGEEKNDGINGGTNGRINGGINLSHTQQAVMNMLEDNGQLTVAEMAEKAGKSKRTVERALSELKGKGCIERVGANKTGFWRVLKESNFKTILHRKIGILPPNKKCWSGCIVTRHLLQNLKMEGGFCKIRPLIWCW